MTGPCGAIASALFVLYDVLQILVVLRTIRFHDSFVTRRMPKNQAIGPRLGQNLWVVHGGLVGNRIVCVALEPLGDMQLVAVKMSRPWKPGFIVESEHIDDERVVIPAAHRVAHVS